jgi:hypothetical protein
MVLSCNIIVNDRGHDINKHDFISTYLKYMCIMFHSFGMNNICEHSFTLGKGKVECISLQFELFTLTTFPKKLQASF